MTPAGLRVVTALPPLSGPGAGAAGHQQRQREPGAQEPGQVIHGRGPLGSGTTSLEP